MRLPMAAQSDILCFHCGKPVGDPPVLNEVAEDEVCPVCRDRVLDSLPPALPSRPTEVSYEDAEDGPFDPSEPFDRHERA